MVALKDKEVFAKFWKIVRLHVSDDYEVIVSGAYKGVGSSQLQTGSIQPHESLTTIAEVVFGTTTDGEELQFLIDPRKYASDEFDEFMLPRLTGLQERAEEASFGSEVSFHHSQIKIDGIPFSDMDIIEDAIVAFGEWLRTISKEKDNAQ